MFRACRAATEPLAEPDTEMTTSLVFCIPRPAVAAGRLVRADLHAAGHRQHEDQGLGHQAGHQRDDVSVPCHPGRTTGVLLCAVL